MEVAELGLAIERHFGIPMDVEFAFAEGLLYALQARPITTHVREGAQGEPILSGLGAAPGRASGTARIVESPADGASVAASDVIVATMTSPDWLPLLRRASALVTDSGGLTCHAAIVSRELGIPCVVGTGGATRKLREGATITVDGTSGDIFRGARAAKAEPESLRRREREGNEDPGETLSTVGALSMIMPPLGTRILVNLSFPQRADRAAALPVDGVGLLRAEFILTEALEGRHPMKLLAEDRRSELLERLVAAVEPIARLRASASAVPGARLPNERVPAAGRR